MWYTLQEKEPIALQDVIILIEKWSATAFYSDNLQQFIVRDQKLMDLLTEKQLTECLWTELPTKKEK